MRCRPGDLALIVRLPECVSSFNGMVVQLQKKPPTSEQIWHFLHPVEESAVQAFRNNGGEVIQKGARLTLSGLHDDYLQPIRGQDELQRQRTGEPEMAAH